MAFCSSSGPYPTSDLLATSAAMPKDLVIRVGRVSSQGNPSEHSPKKTTPTKKQGFNIRVY